MAGITGGCACGAVRYQSSADPTFFLNCHCRDCQRATGSAYAAIVVVPRSALTITGEPRYYSRIADNGHDIERGFCPQCGSPLFVKPARLPDNIAVLAASLDDPTVHRPTIDIFAASAQPWDCMNPDLKKMPKGPSPKGE
jgi:hypothetical protein